MNTADTLDPGMTAAPREHAIRSSREPSLTAALAADGTADPLALILGRFDAAGSASALVAGGRQLTDGEVADAMDALLARLGAGRRVVAIAGTNHLDNVVAVLACLRAGHVALIVPECHLEHLSRAWQADTVVTSGTAHRPRVEVRTDAPTRALHPDLAVLLSTSGSTGAPKLVRLSRRNIAANAEAIAAGLSLGPADRAITSLSPAYCYGLSVLTSHWAAGGLVVLTDRPVTDPAFVELACREGVTTLAGVPHTFELLERVGFRASQVPTLRLLTCAGGRLDPELARRLARRGLAEGWGLSLMYGATEATARMAMLPPQQTETHPGTVGWPVLGGRVRLIDPDADGVGTLAYRGPNVMMGYAQHPEDLARGPELDELVTSDRARIDAEGRIQIVGRVGSYAKVMGLRIDIDRVEAMLAEVGWRSAVAEVGGRLGVLVETSAVGPPRDLADLGVAAHAATGLKPAALVLGSVGELPRLSSGKIDRQAVATALRGTGSTVRVQEPTRLDALEVLVAGYSRLLLRPAAPDDSFAALGGDSMSYVAASLLVERTLGRLPRDWHRLTLSELAAQAPTDRDGAAIDLDDPAGPGVPPAGRLRRWRSAVLDGRQLETSVLVRALAVLAILASHASVLDVRGGAHLLMALVGLGLARFLLVPGDPSRSVRRVLRSSARILVPTAAWVAVVAALSEVYTWAAIGTAWLSSPTTDHPDWRYWFVAALVWILPLTALALRVPQVSAAVSRYPFGAPAAGAVLAWLVAGVIVPDARPSSMFAPLAVAWVFLLGWAIGEARRTSHRLTASALVLALSGLTFEASRAWTIPAGLLALIWLPRVRVPAAFAGPLAAAAAASLVIYLVQWQVLALIPSGWLAVLASWGAGLAGYWLLTQVSQRGRPGVLRLGRAGRARALACARRLVTAS